jgi:hypothetical protein
MERWQMNLTELAKKHLIDDQDYRGVSAGRLLKHRMFVASRYAYLRGTADPAFRSRIRQMKALRGSQRGRAALVTGLGPSLADLNPERTAQQQEAGMAVFGLNRFYRTELAKAIVPDYYVIADPYFFSAAGLESQARGHHADDLANYLQSHTETRLVLPATAQLQSSPAHEVSFFNDLGLEGFTRSVSPVHPRGFLCMTVMHALSVASYLGFGPIWVTGIDSDFFRSMFRGAAGELRIGAHHAYAPESTASTEMPHFDGDAAAYLEDAGRVIADFRLFSHLDIRNTSRQSLVDAFPFDPACPLL